MARDRKLRKKIPMSSNFSGEVVVVVVVVVAAPVPSGPPRSRSRCREETFSHHLISVGTSQRHHDTSPRPSLDTGPRLRASCRGAGPAHSG